VKGAVMSDYPSSFDPTTKTLPEPYLIALGRITYQWTALEGLLGLAIGKLLGLEGGDAKTAIVTAHMSWPQRIDVLETLASLSADAHPHLRRFPQVKTKLKLAQDGRNRLLHGTWIYDGTTVRLLRLSSRGKLKISSDEIHVSEIDSVFSDIGNAMLDLLKLVVNK
jgi:hypothetical protein